MDFKREIFRSIQIMIDERIGNYKADKTFPSVIKQKNTDGTYVVLDDSGGERKVKCCIPDLDLKVGQRVYVKIPSGSLQNIHICGVV